MNNLFVIYDYISNGFIIESLEFISVIALLFGIIVIIIKNPIGSLMCLIGLFATISVYLIITGLNFIGFSYLIVYIGAVSILFLFILMLISVRTSELLSNNVNSVPLALAVIILLNYIWFQLTGFSVRYVESSDVMMINPIYSGTFNEIWYFIISFLTTIDKDLGLIMYVTSNSWESYITETSHVTAIGTILYTVFNVWLLLASIILLLAMVGAIIITIK